MPSAKAAPPGPLGNMLSSRTVATLYSFTETETPRHNGSAQASNHPFADSPSRVTKPSPESPPAVDSPEQTHSSPSTPSSRSSTPKETANRPRTKIPTTDPSRDEEPNVWYLRSARSTRFSQGQPQTFRPPPPRQRRKRPTLKWPKTKRNRYPVLLFSKFWTGCKRQVHFVWLDLLAMMIISLATYLSQAYLPNFRMCERYIPMTYNAVSERFEGPVQWSFPRYDSRNYLDAANDGKLAGPDENSRRTLFERNLCSMAGKAALPGGTFLLPPTQMTLGIGFLSLVTLLLMQIWVRSRSDFTAAKMGITKALIVALFVSVILKKFIGKMRPNFLDYCQLRTYPKNNGDDRTSYNRRLAVTGFCTGDADEVAFALEAFPSGHTMAAFSAGIFLALYLNAKLKAFSSYHTSLWKMMVVLTPVVGAAFVAASVYIDNNHAVEDIVYSVALGEFVAFMSYRAHYASIFNYKTNHMPLPWSSSHRALNPEIPPADNDSIADSIRYRFRNKRNGAAVMWPRKKGSTLSDHPGADRPTATTTPSSAGGVTTGMTAVAGPSVGAAFASGDGGADVARHEGSGASGPVAVRNLNGGADERPMIPHSIRKRARHSFFEDKFKYRRSQGRYSFARPPPSRRPLREASLSDGDGTATVRVSPSTERIAMRLLPTPERVRKVTRQAKRSAGTMV